MTFRVHPYARPHPHSTHHQNMKFQPYHDEFGHIVLSPTTSYSNVMKIFLTMIDILRALDAFRQPSPKIQAFLQTI